MDSGFSRFLIVIALLAPPCARSQDAPRNGGDFSTNTAPVPPEKKIPANTILVKGAWSSASDSTTPVPEGGSVVNGVFRNQYFGLTYPLPRDWSQDYEGPPPSDSGRYVLAQIQPPDSLKGSARGNILITAQDMFFSPADGENVTQLIDFEKDHLQADYKLELSPTQTTISGHPFVFFAYWSPVAELHWYVLATEVRCHTLEIVVTSQDTKLLHNLILDASRMELNLETANIPICIKAHATSGHILSRVDPTFPERSFNPVPVRIIVDKAGRVKHIHFLSAFPGQAKSITDAVNQWRFKPYLQNGHPVEVETGIMFGRTPHLATSSVE